MMIPKRLSAKNWNIGLGNNKNGFSMKGEQQTSLHPQNASEYFTGEDL